MVASAAPQVYWRAGTPTDAVIGSASKHKHLYPSPQNILLVSETLPEKKYEPPEQGTLQPDSRGVCAVGGAGPDERIDEILQSVKAIHAALSVAPDKILPAAPSEIPVLVIKDLADDVKGILSIVGSMAEVELIGAQEEDLLMVDYPRSGKKELPVGTTRINIKARKVELPDDTSELMSMPRPITTCRSFTISTSRQIEIRATIDGTLVYTGSLFAGSQQTNNLAEFDTVEIDTDAVTAFHITLSEDAEGAPDVPPETTAEIQVGYNAAGDMVALKKVVDGVTYQRDVTDPDVADTTVDRWVVYGTWAVV